ncbi:MAG: anaerobic ribonucleoside-triphosphate reductase activating protein [Clostridiales bacterium]|jgi:pyruvate formate lyase activating enzyme|nr:anaerobic ribonucleoside-triphosphate reductase activating protein [Clostridiales bacterium]
MVIGGLQKLTLLDFPGKVACSLFLSGCNFRCPFCHNSALIYGGAAAIEEVDFWMFLAKRRGLLDGVCVSGGEPLINDGIEIFLEKIKRAGFAVKLDTNGSRPVKLKELLKTRAVDYVAMDIKNSPENYTRATGTDCGILSGQPTLSESENYAPATGTDGGADILKGYDDDEANRVKSADYGIAAVKESAAALMESGVPFEFRTTVVKELHTADDFHSVGKWLAGGENYFLQYFKPSENTLSKALNPPSEIEMNEFCGILKEYIPNVKIR